MNSGRNQSYCLAILLNDVNVGDLDCQQLTTFVTTASRTSKGALSRFATAESVAPLRSCLSVVQAYAFEPAQTRVVITDRRYI